MSLTTFKKKSVIQYGSKRSGKPVDKYWLHQGPFGRPDTLASEMLKQDTLSFGPSGTPGLRAGFSLRGSEPEFGRVGKTWAFSQVRTPFRGQYAMGNGGNNGRYYQGQEVMVECPSISKIRGTTSEYVKASSVSNKQMINGRWRWINSGQYPANWVQPNYTGNQTDSASQGLYIHDKSAANDCWYDVNSPEIYVNYFKNCGPTGCQTTPARGYKMSVQQAIAPYTKQLHKPKDASAYTLRVQRKCQNPTGPQKPFPYRVQTGTGVLRGGTSVTNVASSCGTSNPQLVPPAWYLAEPTGQNSAQNLTNRPISQAQVYWQTWLNGTTH